MSTPSRKRLMRDFKRLQQDPPAGISGAPQDNNIMLWNAVIFGYVSNENNMVFAFVSIINICNKYRSYIVSLMPPPLVVLQA